MSSILVVEDEPAIAELIAINLRHAGFEVTIAGDGESAQAVIDGALPSLVILDWMLPGQSGHSLARAWRAQPRTRGLPIIMLTARAEEADKVSGLEAGADDYLTKPFSLAELLARVKALLRRADLLRAAQSAGNAEPRVVRNGELEILPAKRQVRFGGAPLDFTALEFDLLLHFASHPGNVFSRGQLLNAVWGYTHDGYEHTVTTHINRLRAKLEADPMRPELILTVRGAGYKMRDSPS